MAEIKKVEIKVRLACCQKCGREALIMEEHKDQCLPCALGLVRDGGKGFVSTDRGVIG